jgi:hypothetical protein
MIIGSNQRRILSEMLSAIIEVSHRNWFRKSGTDERNKPKFRGFRSSLRGLWWLLNVNVRVGSIEARPFLPSIFWVICRWKVSFVLLLLGSSRSRSRFLDRLRHFRRNSKALGKELARFRLHLPRISTEVPCGFPCPSAPLPRRPCWISAVRGDSFV